MKRTSKAMSMGSLILMLVMISFLTFDVSAQALNTKQLTAEFDKMLSRKFKPTTGCAALVAKNGQIIYQKAWHGQYRIVPMQRIWFRISSITKQFTANIKLIEQGKLSCRMISPNSSPITRHKHIP
jgi:CubicO group peptidase (beta-lactamase class C family)